MPHLASLRDRFADLRRSGKARHRDIAAQLSVSEGELVAAFAGDIDGAQLPLHALRLRAEWPQIVSALQPLGEVLALTRNESCVHEKVGVYSGVSEHGGIGLVLGGAIDLRVFYAQWAHGFALTERLASGATQRSLQFFDAQGQAVHKVFLRDTSDLGAFEQLVVRFTDSASAQGLVAAAPRTPPAPRSDGDIDVSGFQEAWTSMRDTHEFFGLLKRFGVDRTQALRLAPAGYAHAVDTCSAHQVLTTAAQRGVSIMVFVGNPGIVQIHSGPVRRVQVMGPWLNVLDSGFNLHLREDHIAAAWRVRKPTSDGLVSSLELFDAAGNTIAMVFGERKPGRSELCEWRALLDDLPTDVGSAVPSEASTCTL
jgi:putative hemin transport protein